MKYITGFRVFQAIVLIAITSACIVGFFVVGPPSEERARRMDMQRVNDLQQVMSAVDQFYNQTNYQRLPTSLEELRGAQNVYLASIRDPQTKEPYRYNTINTLSYSLCATFETPVDTSNQQPSYTYMPGNTFWDHPTGEKCYTLKVNVNPLQPVAKPVLDAPAPIQDPAAAMPGPTVEEQPQPTPAKTR